MDNVYQFPAKRTWRHGTLFASALEASYASSLDAQHRRWCYEPQRFGPTGYLPDFLIESNRGRPEFIDIKPSGWDPIPTLIEMHAIHDEIPEAVLMVVQPRSHGSFMVGAGCTPGQDLRSGPWACPICSSTAEITQLDLWRRTAAA